MFVFDLEQNVSFFEHYAAVVDLETAMAYGGALGIKLSGWVTSDVPSSKMRLLWPR